MQRWIEGLPRRPERRKPGLEPPEAAQAFGELPPTNGAWTQHSARADWILESAELFDTLAPTDLQSSSGHPPAAELLDTF